MITAHAATSMRMIKNENPNRIKPTPFWAKSYQKPPVASTNHGATGSCGAYP